MANTNNRLWDLAHSREAKSGELGIVFAVIAYGHETSEEIENFAKACENQTIQPAKLLVNFKGSPPGIRSTLQLVLQRSRRSATLTERIQDIVSAVHCSHVVIFANSSCIPKPFLCEKIAIHAARFSPDAIFIERPAETWNSLNYSCLGGGSSLFYTPESVALAICPTNYKSRAGDDSRSENGGLSSRLFTSLIRAGTRGTLSDNLLNFNESITQIVACIAPEFILALSGEIDCGCAGNPRPPKINVNKWPVFEPSDVAPIAEAGLGGSAANPGATVSRGFAEEAIGKHLDLMRESLSTRSQKLFIVPDHFSHSDREIITISNFFDPELYLASLLPDGEAQDDPLLHFLKYGWTKIDEVSKYFHAGAYLRENDDVARAGLNPLVHYLRYGRTEGRSRWGRNGEVSGAEEARLLSSGLFDADYYLSQNADLVRADVDPIWHYLAYGGLEGRSPSVYFDGQLYLEENRDVAEARYNPLLHYILYGREEGRQVRPVNETPWRSRFAGRTRITDRAEWHLDAKIHKCTSEWLETIGTSPNYRADILCCLPYLVRDNLTLRLMDQVVRRGATSLLTVQHATPASYAEDSGPWSKRAGSVLRLYNFSEEQSYPDLIEHIISSRGVKTLLIAGSADIYPMLPYLKRRFKDLFVVDQIFNTTGHTRMSLTFSPYINRYIVESRAMEDFLTQRDIDPTRITVLTSGVNLDYFNRETIDSARVSAFRSNCKFDPSVSFVVGYVGRMSPEKNPLGFLQIAREVTGQRSDVGFLVAGSGPMLDSVKEEAHRTLPAGLVSVAGFVEDVRVAMLSCDLLILPSHVDGRPNAIMEANALGVPVLGSSIGGICELIEDGTNGYLIRPGAYSDFASKIAELTDSPDRQRDLCQSCLRFAADNFDQAPMFGNFFKIVSRSHWPDQPVIT